MEEVKSMFEDILVPYLQLARLHINSYCSGLEPWQIILYTLGTTLVAVGLHGFLFQEEPLLTRMKKKFFKYVRKIPYVQKKVAAEIEKTTASLEENFNKSTAGGKVDYIRQLPYNGLSEAQILNIIEKYKALGTVRWCEGSCSGTVYHSSNDIANMTAKIYGIYAWSNPLHPDVFPDVRKMEAEVVRMCCNMFNGGPDSCGCMTSGGTESIMLACKAYRDMAYENGVKHPEMVVPKSAHAAFDKASDYFRIKIVHIPLDPVTQKVDINKMRKAINRNTCMLVGSAPQFPHGVIDPIEEIGKLGKRYNIPVHVDSCLGGFLVPFMKKAGFDVTPFDFSVEGVTSISADTHKYGFAPKGSSVIMYSDKKYRAFQYFMAPDWTGGIYATATFAGSRAGAIVAACWATMINIGEKGYIESTRKIVGVTRYIEKHLKEIEGIFIYGKPEVSVVGIGSLDFNIYKLSDALAAKGWNLNALQYPSSIHLCCTLIHTNPGVADRFIRDVKDCVAEIMKDPRSKAGGMGAIYGMAQSIPDRSLVAEMAGCFLDACYSTGSSTANGMNHQ